MSYIVYPTIDLYLYDLRHGLGQSEAEIDRNQSIFAQKLPPALHSTLFASDTPFEVEYLELLGQQQTVPLFPEQPNYDSYLYPVRLNDTYGLLVDCSTADLTSPQTAAYFTTLQHALQPYLQSNAPTLGQTWMVSAYLYDSELSQPEITAIAQQIYQAIVPDMDWDETLKGMGTILGGTFFELEQYSINIPEKMSDRAPSPNSTENRHLIVLLYPNAAAAQQAATLLIRYWMRLWCYRHKVLWAYHQNRRFKQLLKQKFTQITQYIHNFRNHEYQTFTLEQLERNLSQAGTLFAQYGIELTQLDYQSRTVEINLHNYQQCLAEMEAKLSQQSAASNIECLRQFARFPFLAQAQKDSENLHPGLSLLEFNINLIRAEVEVKRAKLEEAKTDRDRAFQTQFAIWGTAIAVGAIVTDLSDQFPTVIVPTVAVTEAQPPDANLAIEHPMGSLLSNVGVPELWLAPAISLLSGLSVALTLGCLLLLLNRMWGGARSRSLRKHSRE